MDLGEGAKAVFNRARKKTAYEFALEYMGANGPVTSRDLARAMGEKPQWAGTVLCRLAREGKVVRIGREGRNVIYAIPPPRQ